MLETRKSIPRKIPTFNDLEVERFLKENIVEKGENAGNQHFLLFPQCFFFHFFSLLQIEIIILATPNLLSANAFNFVKEYFFFFSFYWVGVGCGDGVRLNVGMGEGGWMLGWGRG